MTERMAEPRALVHPWGVLSSNTFVSSRIVPLVSLLLLFGAPPARAAPSNPPSVLDQLTASADNSMRAANYADALTALRAAWRIEQRTEIGCNLGLVSELTGHHRDAAEHLLRCSRDIPAPQTPPDKTRREIYLRALATARKEIASLAIRTTPPGADILIDGNVAGRAPLDEIFVEPSQHRITAILGDKAASQTLSLGKGEARTLDLDLTTQAPPEPRPPPPRPPSSRKDPVLIAGTAVTISGLSIAAFALGISWIASGIADAHLSSAQGQCIKPSNAAACEAFRDTQNMAGDLQDTAVASAIGGAIVGAATFSYAQFMRSPPPVSAAVGPRGAFVGVTVSW